MKTRIASLAAIALWASVSVAGQQVSTSYEHNYDFSKVRTFTVKVAPPWSNSKIEAYTTAIVAQELNAKGWTQSPSGSSADVQVVITGKVENRKIQETYYDGGMQIPAGVSGPAGEASGRTVEEKLAEGKVSIFDAKTNDVVFSGAGISQFSSKEKKNEQMIRKGVEKVFKDFPPKPRL